jgi:hypothetical protein
MIALAEKESGTAQARPLSDDRSSAGEKLENQSDDGQYEQDMNESTQRIAAYYSDQPENQQDHKDGPQHQAPPMLIAGGLGRRLPSLAK